MLGFVQPGALRDSLCILLSVLMFALGVMHFGQYVWQQVETAALPRQTVVFSHRGRKNKSIRSVPIRYAFWPVEHSREVVYDTIGARQ